MADQTIVVRDSSYRSQLNAPSASGQRASNGEHDRAQAVNAALELLHAAALGGAFSGGTSLTGSMIGDSVGPLANAIEEALKVKG